MYTYLQKFPNTPMNTIRGYLDTLEVQLKGHMNMIVDENNLKV
jgi:hypothetical protein